MLKRLKPNTPVYISTQNVDMRKNINGLAAVVQGHFGLDPFDGAIFVFCNTNKDKLKVLWWDKDGFVLYYKRREKGRFNWPSFKEESGAISISKNDLHRLLDGLVMEQFIPHKNYTVI